MALWLDPNPLVLASRSNARRLMLEAAGIPVELAAADIDERAVEARNGAMPGPSEAATLLAREKARAVSAQIGGRFIVGADQTLALGAQRFTKPATEAAAREQLRALSGRTHELHSAVAVARDSRLVFSHVETAKLTVRSLSERFIDAYIDAVGPDASQSVGGYQLEKLGVHLFERVDGDYFTILGMPLIALLTFLRREGRLAS